MESHEERGCLINLLVSLLLASVLAWIAVRQGYQNAIGLFFASALLIGTLIRTINMTLAVFSGSTTWKTPWSTLFAILIPAIAIGSYAMYQVSKSYQDHGQGAGIWLLLFIVCLCGVGKFLEDGDHC